MEILLGYCLILHYTADFQLQSRDMAKNKSTNVLVLFKHALIIFTVFTLGLGIAYGRKFGVNVWIFSFLNAIIHMFIDGTIWNIYKWLVTRKLEKDVVGVIKLDPEQHYPPIQIIPIEKRLKEYKFWEDSMFYDTIGLDQFLHVLTIIALGGIFLK